MFLVFSFLLLILSLALRLVSASLGAILIVQKKQNTALKKKANSGDGNPVVYGSLIKVSNVKILATRSLRASVRILRWIVSFLRTLNTFFMIIGLLLLVLFLTAIITGPVTLIADLIGRGVI